MTQEAIIGINSIINNMLFSQDWVNPPPPKKNDVILNRICKAQSEMDFISEVKTDWYNQS